MSKYRLFHCHLLATDNVDALLRQAGVTSGYDSTVESAVTKLMFLQSHYDDPVQVRTLMNRSIRGEISV